jgi:glycopeptide antibiotics resistance protein
MFLGTKQIAVTLPLLHMRKALFFVFAVYLAMLVKVVLFKGYLFFHVVPTDELYKQQVSVGAYTSYNFVPFRTIALFLSDAVSLSAAFFNLAGNIILFVPFGFLLPLLWNKMKHAFPIFLTALSLSIIFELYQLLTNTGQCDIDDVILNTSGSMVGFLLYTLLMKKRSRAY